MSFYLGIDFGTSGVRAIVIDAEKTVLFESQESFTLSKLSSLANNWQVALCNQIQQIPTHLKREIIAVAIDGTSSTVLLCDATGNPVTEPILYNDARGIDNLDIIKKVAPPQHTVLSSTSSLAKLLWWQNLYPEPLYFLHQADWLAFLLHGKLGISDYHNALKLGYDVEQLNYPEWLQKLDLNFHLPEVVTPGTPIGKVQKDVAETLGLSPNCLVCAGTTDSIAAFLASGANAVGEAVTSLGSTLAVKLLSQTKIDDAKYGIYSHRLGDLWLVGGASNTGGAVLKEFFTDEELESLSQKINPSQASTLDYYPLIKAGDRFPINDPNLPPRLEPHPSNPVEFLHGLLESIARIEARGYHLLQQLGANPLKCVYTAGGGAKNYVWTQIRARNLQVSVLPSRHLQAAYGTALLAMQGTEANFSTALV
ncbi:FGGY-family carbohydrate kinase [Merismopedia glauca]|uniref:D-ribulose kinase n=1 Tax=Merismopedia glauca CCAP 1448/3 TaxID=1296344 RepID=A0A2T1BXM0_9CYAN|nr:FGGY-family carbohydrate kinase [Merismopedia glauca]PSB00657.1 carbohydrate kinase [Merismopedia glauca CCAP 1448/3]